MQNLGQCLLQALLVAFIGLFTPSCKPVLTPDLCETDLLLWSSPIQAQARLESMDTTCMDSLNRMYYQLIAEHLRLKNHTFDQPGDLRGMIDFFIRHHQPYLAGEALYVQGTEWMGLARPYEAMHSLIRARYLLQEADSTAFLLGMTFYRIGTVYEQDKLYAAAYAAYEQALPLLKHYPFPRYTGCLFRDMARTVSSCKKDIPIDSLNAIRQAWIDSALYYIQLTGDKELYDNIVLFRYNQTAISPISADALPTFRRLLAEYPHKGYAYCIAEYYLSQKQPDSAYYYLNILAQDTIATPWNSKLCDLYHELHSYYSALTDNAESAYYEMRTLYTDYTKRILEQSAFHVDAIVRQYEVQEERNMKNRLIIERQQARFTWIGICCTLLFILIILLLIIRHQKDKRLKLEQELQNKLDLLREQLLQRVQTVKQLRLMAISRKLSDEHIRLIESLNQELLAPQDAQMKLWTDSFNLATHSLLERLKSAYPRLTHSDSQALIFIALNIPVSDMCLLLQSSKETLWRRRNRIKQHLGLHEEDDLDDWLRQQIKTPRIE